ncbi:PilW family protein [Ramlibacter sp.]|uniref:PilW family protein n=1 Tax=Ramlibacter sp. TaxID=1917967 RepID=UPI002B6955E0|nr:PilW family protein [Ramlibacter sp.]HWI83154.1 PilW family protein [Ramlibacter sp.]
MKSVPHSTLKAHDRRQRGFTLVELLISIVLGLFIVLALLTLLINVNRNNGEMAKSNRVIENGRFSIQLLESEVSHAGFWAGFLPLFDDLTFQGAAPDVPRDYPAGAPVVTAVPDPCANWAALAADPDPQVLAQHKTNLLGIAVQSYEIPATVPSPTVPVCANRVVNPKGNTDVLIVRHAETCVPGVDGCPALAANELYLQLPQCGATMPTPPYAFEQYDAANVNTLFPHRVRAADCATAAYADKRKFASTLYYVRRYSVTDGDNIPTLMRSQFGWQTVGGVTALQFGAPEALIEGIEAFKVELGIDNVSDSGVTLTDSVFNTTGADITLPAPTDAGLGAGAAPVLPSGSAATVTWANVTTLTSPTNRGDGIPDLYKRCSAASPCSAFELMNAVAVKLFVLVRSENTTPGYTDAKTYCLASQCASGERLGPFNDGYKRHLFTQTIRLINVSNRRETPPT